MFLVIEATVVDAEATNLLVAFPPGDCLINICLRPPRTRLALLAEINLRAGSFGGELVVVVLPGGVGVLVGGVR